MDHVRELQGRLFAVVIVFVVVSAAAYPFFDKIVNFILAPLGSDHELVYLTPGGAFSFIIQACMYVGFIGALPAIIYNIYRFIMPVMKKNTLNKALVFTVTSLILALGGMIFAYYVSLPAALYFLTNFNLYHINPMLTIDSYFSFVMTYMLAGALLFQIPLIMLMINGVTPLRPKKLMKLQDKIILGSFIIAAIISPTPDALNQTLLASPMIVMYQAGIVLVWLKNRRKHSTVAGTVSKELNQSPKTSAHVVPQPQQVRLATVNVRPQTARIVSDISGPIAHGNVRPKQQIVYQQHPARSVDGFMAHSKTSARPLPKLDRRQPTLAERQLHPRASQLSNHAARSLDGFLVS